MNTVGDRGIEWKEKENKCLGLCWLGRMVEKRQLIFEKAEREEEWGDQSE